MVTIQSMIDALCPASRLDPAETERCARALQETGHLPKGDSLASVPVDEQGAAAMLVGLCAPPGGHPGELIGSVAALPFAGLWSARAGANGVEQTEPYPSPVPHRWHEAPFLDALTAGLLRPDTSAPIAIRIGTAPIHTAAITLLQRPGLGCLERLAVLYVAPHEAEKSGLLRATSGLYRESATTLPHPAIKVVRDLLAQRPAASPIPKSAPDLRLVGGTLH